MPERFRVVMRKCVGKCVAYSNACKQAVEDAKASLLCIIVRMQALIGYKANKLQSHGGAERIADDSCGGGRGRALVMARLFTKAWQTGPCSLPSPSHHSVHGAATCANCTRPPAGSHTG